MPRYIDAELAKAEFTGNFQDNYATAHIKALIDSTPTADVQPVVHCKDCKHYGKNNSIGCLYGERWNRAVNSFRTTANNFCSYGAKMEV